MPRSVIPAKPVLSNVEGAGIQTLPVGHCVQIFRQFLTSISINYAKQIQFPQGKAVFRRIRIPELSKKQRLVSGQFEDLAFQDMLCHFGAAAEKFGEVVDKDLFDFAKCFLLRFSNQLQVAQAVRSGTGQSNLIGEICLTISANKAVSRVAEMGCKPIGTKFIFAVYAGIQDRLQADFFQQGQLK